MTVKFETETIRTIALFERLTRVNPRDCLITESCIYFLVDPEKVGLAIGRKGSNIKEVRKTLGRDIKVFGYYRDPKELIRNMIPSIKNIEMNNGSMIITVPSDKKTVVIGRNGRNIKAIKEIMKRHFKIKHIRLK